MMHKNPANPQNTMIHRWCLAYCSTHRKHLHKGNTHTISKSISMSNSWTTYRKKSLYRLGTSLI